MKSIWFISALPVLLCAEAAFSTTGSVFAPAYDAPVAADTQQKQIYPKLKIAFGSDGTALDVSSINPIPMAVYSAGGGGGSSQGGFAPAWDSRVAADSISSLLYPKFKLSFGIDGVATDVSTTNPLPVTCSNCGGGTGNVTGPNSSTTNAIATYSDTTGKVIKDNPAATIDGSGNITAHSFIGPLAANAASSITGSADAIQFTINENATQSSDVFRVNASDLVTNELKIDSGGSITSRGGFNTYAGFGMAAGGSEFKFFPGGGGSLPYFLFGTDSAGTGFQGPAFTIGTTGTYSSQDLFDIQSNTVNQVQVTHDGVLHPLAGLTLPSISTPTEVVTNSSGVVSGRPLLHSAGNSGSTLTIDFSTGTSQTITMTAAVTFTFSNQTAGTTYIIKLTQDGTGGWTATWPGSVKFPAGTAPTLSTAANAVDIVTCWFDGTNNNCNFGLNYH